MAIFDFLKKKKKRESPKEAEADVGSDHPVHEEFVDEKGLRETKEKEKKAE